MKTYYHGTTSNFLPSIQAQGLMPCPANVWHLSNISGNDGTHVYLTANKKLAMQFADEKANYLRSLPGPYPVRNFGFFETWKKPEIVPVVPDSRPILLTLQLPNNWKPRRDPESGRMGGLMTSRKIPAKYIKDVKFLKDVDIKFLKDVEEIEI